MKNKIYKYKKNNVLRLVLSLVIVVVFLSPAVVGRVDIWENRLEFSESGNAHLNNSDGDIHSDSNLVVDGTVTANNATFNYVDKTEITEPNAPNADTLRLFVAAAGGFSKYYYKDEYGVVRSFNDDEIIVKNVRGTTIDAHRIVYVAGNDGGVPTVDTAKADSISTMPAIGVTIEAIENNGFGRVLQTGQLNNVNTNSYEIGTIYVSDTTAGIPTNTPPVTPSLTQEIGTILVKDAAVGEIQIISRALTGDEFGTINDFNIRLDSIVEQEFYANKSIRCNETVIASFLDIANDVNTSGDTNMTGNLRVDGVIGMHTVPDSTSLMKADFSGTTVDKLMEFNFGYGGAVSNPVLFDWVIDFYPSVEASISAKGMQADFVFTPVQSGDGCDFIDVIAYGIKEGTSIGGGTYGLTGLTLTPESGGANIVGGTFNWYPLNIEGAPTGYGSATLNYLSRHKADMWFNDDNVGTSFGAGTLGDSKLSYDGNNTVLENLVESGDGFNISMDVNVSGNVLLGVNNSFCVTLINNDTGTLSVGDVVVVDTGTDMAVVRTTTQGHEGVAGVVVVGGASDSLVSVAVGGVCVVKTVDSVTRGNFVETSTTAGKVRDSGSGGGAGDFGVALTGCTGAGSVSVLFKKSEVY